MFLLVGSDFDGQLGVILIETPEYDEFDEEGHEVPASNNTGHDFLPQIEKHVSHDDGADDFGDPIDETDHWIDFFMK